MRVTGFVIALGGLLLSAPSPAPAQQLPAPIGVVAMRTADRTPSIVADSAARSAADASAASSVLDARDFTAPREAAGAGEGLGRVAYIVIGAAVGAGVAAGVLAIAKSTSDCECGGRSMGYAAMGGGVVGGFLGSVAYGMRRDQGGTTTPARND